MRKEYKYFDKEKIEERKFFVGKLWHLEKVDRPEFQFVVERA